MYFLTILWFIFKSYCSNQSYIHITNNFFIMKVLVVKSCSSIHIKNPLEAGGMRGKNIKSGIWNPYYVCIYFQKYHIFLFNFYLLVITSYESTTDRTEAPTTETAKETTKGQLISKCLFWCLQFFQKTNKTIGPEVS